MGEQQSGELSQAPTDFIHFLLVLPWLMLQLMQQQTVLSASHGSFMSPSVTFSPCHIQQIGTVSLNGLPTTPIAQTSGAFLTGCSLNRKTLY